MEARIDYKPSKALYWTKEDGAPIFFLPAPVQSPKRQILNATIIVGILHVLVGIPIPGILLKILVEMDDSRTAAVPIIDGYPAQYR